MGASDPSGGATATPLKNGLASMRRRMSSACTMPSRAVTRSTMWALIACWCSGVVSRDDVRHRQQRPHSSAADPSRRDPRRAPPPPTACSPTAPLAASPRDLRQGARVGTMCVSVGIHQRVRHRRVVSPGGRPPVGAGSVLHSVSSNRLIYARQTCWPSRLSADGPGFRARPARLEQVIDGHLDALDRRRPRGPEQDRGRGLMLSPGRRVRDGSDAPRRPRASAAATHAARAAPVDLRIRRR
jgi:hypothetical protein